jgi:ectoine hydroxylase-related dioxygenase (phytanoyl-CoA dioxygenase family)
LQRERRSALLDRLRRRFEEDVASGKQRWQSDKQGGSFTEHAIDIQKQLESRWLGEEYRAGDVLVFGMHTLHAAGDNQTDAIRLSTDSRYQPADEPADERWIGPHPIGHGPASKKGMIC